MRIRLGYLFPAMAFVVLSVVNLLATENSLVYGPLANSATFRGRVVYIITQQAPVVLAEASNVTCHTKRADLAARIAADPVNFASVFATHLTTNINVTSGGNLTGSGSTLDTPATDAALLAAVASLWNTVAGCVANP